jgi:hypothetical protein
MIEIVYLSLSHFNYETRTYFLQQAGYSSLLDYELSTQNPLFEICWNGRQSRFEVEPSRLETVNEVDYFSRHVSFASLSLAVKDYLFSRFFKDSTYANFEEFFLNHHASLPSVFVFIPFKLRRPATVPVSDIKVECSATGFRKVNLVLSKKKELDGFVFYLNPKTENSYVLVPPTGDVKLNGNRYGTDGWNLFGGKSSPIFFRKDSNCFIVSKKYYRNLLEKGAYEN